MDRRRSVVYLIITGSLLAGLVTGRALFFNVAYAFIGLLVFSLLWAWSGASWLKLIRQTRARRAQVGSTLEELFTVQNTSFLPKLWLEVYDQSDLPGHRASFVAGSLGPFAEASSRVRTLCTRRGAFQLGPLRIVTGDPFGLFQTERRINATSPLVVYPATVEVGDLDLPLGSLPGGDALRRRTHHVTTNAAGVRDYAPGDSLNRIHWLSTARKGRLIAKEFELDPLADIWLLLDAERAVQAGSTFPAPEELPLAGLDTRSFAIPPTTEEYGVTITASLARHFLERGRAVGFAAHGRRPAIIQADRGARQLTKILEALAVLEAAGSLALEQLMTLQFSQLARGTTVVLVTSSTRQGWVTAAHSFIQRGLQMAAVVIDPYSFGGRAGATQMAQQLGTLGIPACLIRRDDDLTFALSFPRIGTGHR